MKQSLSILALVLSTAGAAFGHDLTTGEEHPHYDRSVKPPEFILAQASAPPTRVALVKQPVQAAAFAAFAPRISVRWDERFLFVEGNGLPAHNMMVGITAWQQQVPLPQKYTGANAWQIPLVPVPAKTPLSIRNRFLRGAIALAANGIPIFNPQNNRGEISQEIGELDEWGGHCGRADDYHYHAAPLHLQSVLGKALPIAYALDGYAIYGLTEPDGSVPAGLDAFNGHTTAALGYHYHASRQYPYVNGGFHGEVVEREEQVDPQPHAQPVRPALQVLRGAKITGLTTSADEKERNLSYSISGKAGTVKYMDLGNGAWKFQFISTDGTTHEESYQAREGRGGGQGRPRPDGAGQPPRDGTNRPPRREGDRPENAPPASNAPVIGMDAMKKPSASFVLSSPEVGADHKLPAEYTGDGSGATPPLSWKGAPAGTKSYAIVIDHLAPGNVVKSYWTMWDIPAGTTSLPKNVQGVGKVGTSFKGQVGYEPPHSQGPGAKTYVVTVYALSAPPQITAEPRLVTRELLLAALKDKVLASASMDVIYAREGAVDAAPDSRPTREGQPPSARPPGGGGGKGAPDNKGLIKPAMTDTVHVNVYADNWFAMFINGEQVAVDSIKFTPHNVVSFDILPEYPMTIAVIAKDNADVKTGLEYGDHIGDGGFTVKFSDGTVSNASWKAKSFFKGPLERDLKHPRVEHTPIPDHWWAVDFDDHAWAAATEFTEERVNPKQPYFEADFKGAKFIWSDDLDVDNTVIFRTRIEKPGWTKRWNTKPDLDISGAPFK